MEIYFLRHASPEENGQVRRCLGRVLDVPLSEQGRQETEAVREKLSGTVFDRICVSPLLRARQTAEILCPGCAQTVLPELTEVSGGVWDGM